MRQGRRKCLFKEDWGGTTVLAEEPHGLLMLSILESLTPCSQLKKGTSDMHDADRIIQFFIVIILMHISSFQSSFFQDPN